MRLLVVEDETKLAAYLKKGLMENGHVVDVASDGIDGRHLATQGDYDLVILDVMIPGVDETLRVNGRARLNDEAAMLATFADVKRTPKLVIEVTVIDAYLHCAKAFMRSKLWSTESRIERTALPTMGEMLSDQTGMPGAPETQAEMRARYAADL